jgi:hypothetical protein
MKPTLIQEIHYLAEIAWRLSDESSIQLRNVSPEQFDEAVNALPNTLVPFPGCDPGETMDDETPIMSFNVKVNKPDGSAKASFTVSKKLSQ